MVLQRAHGSCWVLTGPAHLHALTCIGAPCAALVNFVCPDALGSLATFKRVFGDPILRSRDRGASRCPHPPISASNGTCLPACTLTCPFKAARHSPCKWHKALCVASTCMKSEPQISCWGLCAKTGNVQMRRQIRKFLKERMQCAQGGGGAGAGALGRAGAPDGCVPAAPHQGAQCGVPPAARQLRRLLPPHRAAGGAHCRCSPVYMPHAIPTCVPLTCMHPFGIMHNLAI